MGDWAGPPGLPLDEYVERAKCMRCVGGGHFADDPEEMAKLLQASFCTIVKNSFRRWLKDVGACQRCGAVDNLQRSHRRDCSRPKLLREAIERIGTRTDRGIAVNHRELRDAFLDLHKDDLHGRRLLCLCASCHREYDRPPAVDLNAGGAAVP